MVDGYLCTSSHSLIHAHLLGLPWARRDDFYILKHLKERDGSFGMGTRYDYVKGNNLRQVHKIIQGCEEKITLSLLMCLLFVLNPELTVNGLCCKR